MTGLRDAGRVKVKKVKYTSPNSLYNILPLTEITSRMSSPRSVRAKFETEDENPTTRLCTGIQRYDAPRLSGFAMCQNTFDPKHLRGLEWRNRGVIR